MKDARTTIQTTLSPYVLALTSEQRKTIAKLGDGTVPFVDRLMDYSVLESAPIEPCSASSSLADVVNFE
ncbi:hypothetical protein [Reichenbachiella sp. 5M10]|uniref:hypothetical protein n=1 Tax=Reichenbachiella sp. 5M10 TaxID=1889772 RepID=UPI00117B30D9|nr:hypothetical protein [Reichenbachiella sp. 5M10]